MAGTTPNLGLWYPDGSDPVSDGDDGLRSLTAALDSATGTIVPFPDAAARDAALPNPQHGAHAYLTGTDELTVWTGSAWTTRRYAPLSASGAYARSDTTSTLTPNQYASLGVTANVSNADPGRWNLTWTALISNSVAGGYGNLRATVNGVSVNGDHRADTAGESTRIHSHSGLYQFVHAGGDITGALFYQALAGTASANRGTSIALSWVGPQ